MHLFFSLAITATSVIILCLNFFPCGDVNVIFLPPASHSFEFMSLFIWFFMFVLSSSLSHFYILFVSSLTGFLSYCSCLFSSFLSDVKERIDIVFQQSQVGIPAYSQFKSHRSHGFLSLNSNVYSYLTSKSSIIFSKKLSGGFEGVGQVLCGLKLERECRVLLFCQR